MNLLISLIEKAKTSKGIIFIIFWLSILLSLLYFPFKQPLLNADGGIFVFLSQIIARGDSLYENSGIRYTPLTFIISGLGMKIGAIFSIPTFFVPRILGVICASLISSLIYLVSFRIYKNKLIGIIGAGLFLSIPLAVRTSSQGLEPKLLVAMFFLLGFLFIQKKRYFYTGLFFSMAAMAWQPAVILLISFGIYQILLLLFFKENHFNFYNISRFFIGIFVGTLPVLFYLIITNSFDDFIMVTFKLGSATAKEAAGRQNHFLWVLQSFRFIKVLSIMSLLGIIFCFCLIPIRYKVISESVKKGFLFLFTTTVLWCIFSSYYFQARQDLLHIIPLFAIWPLFIIYLLFAFNKLYLKVGAIIIVMLFIVSNFGLGINNNLKNLELFNLQMQNNVINELEIEVESENILAIGYLEYYILKNKKAPTRYTKYCRPVVIRQMNYIEQDDACKKVTNRLISTKPKGVILSTNKNKSICKCLKNVEKILMDKPLKTFRIKGRKYNIYKTIYTDI